MATPSGTARARSASSRITFGDLPPSSIATGLTVAEASSETRRPARVEPVKETMSTPGCPATASPATGPVPVRRLKTPAGRPAASITSARMKALSGVTSLGLSTTVQPAARAGATLAAIWLSGKFQGVIAPSTPTGSRSTRELPISSSQAISSISPGIAANWAVGRPAWMILLSLIGMPSSCEIVAAISSERSPSPAAIAER